uniref:Transmembrane and coiled-coil domain-containing protein 5B-like n=1 Tax=Ursus maritimus TaxID=29073 RepID=A0A452ULE8_URSMA
MEAAGQDPLGDVQEMMEIPKLEVTKQNLDYLNSDLEKDLQRLDEANQVLLRKIQEKEEAIQSLEGEIALSLGRAKEREELNHIASEKEETLRTLESETAKLVRGCLEKDPVVHLACSLLLVIITHLSSTKELQKSTESCAKQEKELLKIESDYQSLHQLCEDQAHYIKKYQEILRQMEKEKEVLLLEKEGFSDQFLFFSGEKTIIKKQKRIFWYRHFRCLVFMVVIFIRLLGYALFHLQYINPDLLVDALPMVMSRDALKRLREVLFPFFTLEVEEVLPH